MSYPCPVAGCDLDATEWSVCRSCAGRLRRDLARIPSLAADVEATMARQAVTVGSRSAKQVAPPLGYDPRASEALGTLRVVLVGWVRVLADEDTRPAELAWPEDSIAGCAAWLGERVPALRVHPAAGDVCSEVAAAVAGCWTAIDRPPLLWFAGPCNACGAAMYSRPEALAVSCRDCGATYPTEGRRRFLLEAARDYRLTTSELGRALAVPASTIRSWRRRGRLVANGEAGGQATFRIGDVLDLLTA